MIRTPALAVAALAAALPAPVAAAGPLQVVTAVQIEERYPAADGSVGTRMIPATRAVPGDRLVVTVGYRNTGAAPIAALTVVNPVPAGMAYRGPAPGSPAPEVSSDGRRFAPLAQLDVGGRPAVAADVVQVRWRVAGPVAPGGGGRFAFQAVVK